MAFNDNNKKNYEQESYSKYGSSNINGVEPSKLSYSYWSGNLCIAISPKKNTPNGEVAFDYDNNAKIYLTHHNARIFSTLIKEWKKDHSKYNNAGVATRNGTIIAISDGKEFGIDIPCIFIKKVNENTGMADATFVYTFKNDYYNGIINYDSKSGSFEKLNFPEIELDELVTVLDTYVNAMTGAVAYTVRDEMKYIISPINTKTDSICEKLGIDYGKKGNYNNGGNNYFNNNSNNSSFDNSMNKPTSMQNSSIDELDDGLE